MVLGRTSELKYLNTCYDREGSQIMVVYGEKNVGKTALLDEFVQDKPHSYYCARPASEREQRYRWGMELWPEAFTAPGYPAFGEIFQSIAGEETSAVSDGTPVLKGRAEKTQVMVVLCSSSIGWVENSMITRIGEAAYEISGFLKIKELSFETMMEFFPGFSMEQCVEAYAVLGGIPGLWMHFNDKIGIRENICKYILDKNAFLNREGQRIMEEELRETGVYNTILASIAAGKHKLNELYLHTGFSRAKISVYLKNLMELELVEKIFSYDTEGKANTQKGIYRIKNHFVHFYFTYLYPNLSGLEQLPADAFYKKQIAPYFKSYVAEYFKTVCKQHVEKLNKWGRLPIEIDRMGEWAGKLGNIDVIAQDAEGKTIIGVCNWEKNIMSYADYEWLLFCAEKAKIRADYIYLFSVKRFDEKLNLEAKMKQNLKLISMDEM